MRIDHDLIKQQRLKRAWTQREAAERIGIDERTYRRYEQGRLGEVKRATIFETLSWIAKAFDLSGPDVLLLSGRPQGQPPSPDTPYDAEWYVHREEEERWAQRLLETPGAPLVLQGPWLFGKATLLGHLIEQWSRRERGTAIRVNLAQLDEEALSSLDGLLAALARKLLDQVDPQRSAAWLEETWHGYGSPKGKLDRLLVDRVLPACPRLLLAIERAEALLGCPFQHEFFALLRSWSEAKGQQPWSGLRLAVTLSTEPTLLEQVDSSSFFALTRPIVLGDLSTAQLARLSRLYGSTLPSEALARLEAVVGGHPYLWRVALNEAALLERSLPQILDEMDQHGGIFCKHLLRMRKWLEGEEELSAAIAQLLERPDVHLRLEVYGKLYSRGLLVEVEVGVYRLRCKLFEDYFRRLYRIGNTASAPREGVHAAQADTTPSPEH